MTERKIVGINRSEVQDIGEAPRDRIATIGNVRIAERALQRAMQRDEHLPGLVALYGPSGYGKSFGVTRVAHTYRGYQVECRSTWTAKALLLAVLKEMGIRPAKTIYDMADQAAEQLALSGRPLIVDEFDFLVNRSAVEIIRDLHESSSGAAILLVGEENLERNLRRWERFHNRVLEWCPVEPATLEDCRALAELYCPECVIADDLLDAVLQRSRRITRRICVNIARIRALAVERRMKEITAADWADRPIDSGDAPRRGAA